MSLLPNDVIGGGDIAPDRRIRKRAAVMSRRAQIRSAMRAVMSAAAYEAARGRCVRGSSEAARGMCTRVFVTDGPSVRLTEHR
jgi:hypothetical protein